MKETPYLIALGDANCAVGAGPARSALLLESADARWSPPEGLTVQCQSCGEWNDEPIGAYCAICGEPIESDDR